jgi:hypothetical protein
MTDAEFRALRATMPWKERVFQTARGGVVQIVDRAGNEVPMFQMTRFLVFITARLETATKDQ